MYYAISTVAFLFLVYFFSFKCLLLLTIKKEKTFFFSSLKSVFFFTHDGNCQTHYDFSSCLCTAFCIFIEPSIRDDLFINFVCRSKAKAKTCWYQLWGNTIWWQNNRLTSSFVQRQRQENLLKLTERKKLIYKLGIDQRLFSMSKFTFMLWKRSIYFTLIAPNLIKFGPKIIQFWKINNCRTVLQRQLKLNWQNRPQLICQFFGLPSYSCGLLILMINSVDGNLFYSRVNNVLSVCWRRPIRLNWRQQTFLPHSTAFCRLVL